MSASCGQLVTSVLLDILSMFLAAFMSSASDLSADRINLLCMSLRHTGSLYLSLKTLV